MHIFFAALFRIDVDRTGDSMGVLNGVLGYAFCVLIFWCLFLFAFSLFLDSMGARGSIGLSFFGTEFIDLIKKKENKRTSSFLPFFIIVWNGL